MTQELLDPPQTQAGGGFLSCNCPCHKTIEQGGGRRGNCVHCRVIGTRAASDPPQEDQ